jgi:PAS domain S-box-containing protein
VLLIVTLIAGVSLALLLIAADRVVSSHSLGRSGEDLRAARVAFTRLVETRVQSAMKAARLVTELPTFQATLTDPRVWADAPTVSAMIADYCGKLGAMVCVVSDLNGVWLGQSGAAAGASRSLAPAIDAARSGRAFNDIVALGDTLFLIVAEPVRFTDEVLATFTAGYLLDDAVARDLKLVTHVDVSFVCSGSSVCASSLSTALRKALSDALAAEPGAMGEVNGQPQRHNLDGGVFVGGSYPLRAGALPGPQLVLLQDWSPTEQALRQMQMALLGVGLLTFVVALGATLVFSSRLTRPLRDLSSVANEVAGGNWARRVPVDGYAEARSMAEAFNHMTVTLSHWHEQARQQTVALNDAYGRFRSVTDSANDAIVSVNNRGEIVFWNPRAEAVFGYPEAEAMGQPLACLLPPDTRDEYRDRVAELMAEGDRGRTLELVGLRRDGGQVPIELSLSTWKTGTELFYTGVIRDITERLQAAEAARQHEEQLRQVQKMEAVGRLAGGIAHDFNNLLTAILGYADLLLATLAPGDPVRADILEIQAAGRSAASLTRDLLAFSRKQVMQPIVLDLNAVITGTENLVRRLVGEHIDLSIELAADLPHVKADRTQIAQVLINLAVNARDAMPDGGKLTIATAVVIDANDDADEHSGRGAVTHVVLRVVDTGHGMPDDVRAHIFEPFFTTKEVGKGTGLGLATVYGIVRQSGGHITVESALGAGTTFHVSLPAIDAEVSESGLVMDGGAVAGGGSETILLVEDNDAVRGLARQTLTRYGYSVLDAANAEEALAIASTRLDQISLVVTDIVMPGMNGRALARRLRADRPDVRIIFTSGYTNDMTTPPDQGGPGTAFLHKPFAPSLLGRTVRELIDRPIPETVVIAVGAADLSPSRGASPNSP